MASIAWPQRNDLVEKKIKAPIVIDAIIWIVAGGVTFTRPSERTARTFRPDWPILMRLLGTAAGAS
jgi:hypothetical protein